MPATISGKRLGVLGGLALVLLGLVCTRTWFLQVVDAEGLETRVAEVRTRTVSLLPERGRIFDVDGRVLADNERVLIATIDRAVVRKPAERAELFLRLSGALQTPVTELERRYQSKLYDPLQPLPLREGISEQTALFLRERSEDYPGVDVEEGWRREYPYAPIGSHVVGFMGAILERQLPYYKSLRYSPNERVGQYGVEQTYESVLRGKPGYVRYEVNALGQIIREIERVEPIPGNDVQLAIDLDYQQFIEQALETMLSLRRQVDAGTVKLENGDPDPQYAEVNFYKAPAGSALLMNYDTGEIVAMASYPNFDNRWFNAGISSSKFKQLFPETKDPDQAIIVNRAVSGRYNLGSTFKPFTAFAALDSGQIAEPLKFKYRDEGTYKLESIPNGRCQEGVKCVFKNAFCSATNTPCRYGPVTVEDALAVSSDTFFYKIGEQILTQRGYRPILEEEVRNFGFGAPTGIDLPFEYGGALPSKELKKSLADAGAIPKEEGRAYYVGDNVQFAIGQGLLAATPLQLGVSYSVLANNGRVVTPHVTNRIFESGTPDGDAGFADLSKAIVVEDRTRGEVIRTVEMPPEVHDPIVRGLTRVVNGPGVDWDFYHKATGEFLFKNYPKKLLPIAGKTGTAQGFKNLPWNDSSAFAAFSLDPTRPFTAVAYLEKSGYGSQGAAPVVKCVFSALAGVVDPQEVIPSNPLDINSTAVARSQRLVSPLCLSGYGGGVRD
ncbi:MAG: penicillin-binding transpeptidase domain-containing protein [Actinomycetota bacterium]